MELKRKEEEAPSVYLLKNSNHFRNIIVLFHFFSLCLKSPAFHKLRFSFLSFLIEVVNVPTSSFVQVVSMINSLMSSSKLKEQMIFQSLEHQA